MQLWMIVSAAAVFGVGWMSALPPVFATLALLVTSLLLAWRFPHPTTRCGFCLALGLTYGQLWGEWLLAARLPAALESRSLQVDVIVLEAPQLRRFSRGGQRQRFAARLHLTGSGQPLGRALLSYYGDEPLRAGERWRGQVKLKRPHGLANPGSFNFEGWLARQRFSATGYLRERPLQRLGRAAWWRSPHQQLRQDIADALRAGFRAQPELGVLLALASGDRSELQSAQWRQFQRYGLNHLVVISGLHVGLVAGLGFLGGRLLGWRSAHLAAAGTALFYSALAGFALPTLRALVMLASVQLLAIGGRRIRPLACLSLALFAIALIDPLATHSAGFWLSFGAVAFIFYLRFMWPGLSPLRLTLALQCLLALVMGIVSSFWFGGFGLFAPLANLVAVPLLSFWMAPLCLAGAALLPFSSAGALGLWQLAAVPVTLFFRLDEWLQSAGPGGWIDYRPDAGALLAFLLGVLLLLAHRALPLRWLGVLFLGLLLSPSRPALPPGKLDLWVLDVGQGLAVVVQAGDRVMVYDTGAGDPAGPNMASAVIAPFLLQRGIRAIDLLVLSHGDSDHASGAVALHQRFEVAETWYGDTPLPGITGQRACRAGMRRRLDELALTVLHPGPVRPARSNNRSCVLGLEFRGLVALFPGDIEARVERRLVLEQAAALRADVLLVPHHGSRSSSSRPFLAAVDPCIAVVSRGYRNRFGHPHPAVLERYRRQGSTLVDTASSGAVRLRLAEGGELRLSGWREQRHFYWSSPPSPVPVPAYNERHETRVQEVDRCWKWLRRAGG